VDSNGFPLRPTRRFTNGRTEIDIIRVKFMSCFTIATQLLGFEKFIPPFANTSGSDILKGVNYASGEAGIRIETNSHLVYIKEPSSFMFFLIFNWFMGATISFRLQLANHIVIVSQIVSKLGSPDLALQYLEKCLYYVNIGSNDYKNNYFHPQLYPTSCIYSLEQYAQAVIEELWKFDYDGQALHNLGVRKYVLAGLGRIGCTPTVMHSHGTNGSCVEEQNAAISNYNNKLKALVDQFNDRFSTNSKFILIYNESNAIDIAHDVFSFGVVLLELISGQHPIQKSIGKEESLVIWVPRNYTTKLGNVLGPEDSGSTSRWLRDIH
ncbi:GDSL esterase/lipase, partial [Glycine soja]